MHRLRNALIAVAALATTADARGIYFHAYGKAIVVAESAVMQRCDPPAKAILVKAGHQEPATCRSVPGGGTLGSIARAQGGVDLLFLAPDGAIRWRSTFAGRAVYATDAMIVLEDGATLRAVWLDPRDGHTLDTVAFVPDAKPLARAALPDGCDDIVQATFHSTEPTPRLAAVCVVLD